MVGLGRVELPTSPLSGVRSSQLSYRPVWDPLSKNFQRSQGERLTRAVPRVVRREGGAASPRSPRKKDSQNFFEDRLNVHTGVAGTDHLEDRARKRCPNGTPMS